MADTQVTASFSGLGQWAAVIVAILIIAALADTSPKLGGALVVLFAVVMGLSSYNRGLLQ